ncbi:hypothetical protein V6N13_076926 [Hibiscus sabdariffa]|uniref:Uncharacterized protein n=1 Tax=Hibiscus sabdariffa TaxID=183260 RepID=A0ABR2CMS4_9ROSI
MVKENAKDSIFQKVAEMILRDEWDNEIEKELDEFWGVVEEMKGEGSEMDIDMYIKISNNFLKFMMLEDAVKLYEFMMNVPYKPSEQD